MLLDYCQLMFFTKKTMYHMDDTDERSHERWMLPTGKISFNNSKLFATVNWYRDQNLRIIER